MRLKSRCKHASKRGILACASAFVLAVCANPAVCGQQAPCTRREIPVSVVSHAGQPVSGLTPAAISAKVGGKPVQISSVSPPNSPPAVLLLLDTSGSMRDFPGGPKAEADFAESLVSQLPATTPVELAIFGRDFLPVMAPTVDRSSLHVAFEHIRDEWARVSPPYGATALNEALLECLSPRFNLKPGDVIFVVTDGMDNASSSKMARARAAFLLAGIRVFSAISSESHGMKRVHDPEFVHDIVESSGGESIDIPISPTEWKAALAPSVSAMTDCWLLTVDLPANMTGPQKFQLQITDKTIHAGLRYPRQAFPCGFSLP